MFGVLSHVSRLVGWLSGWLAGMIGCFVDLFVPVPKSDDLIISLAWKFVEPEEYMKS